MNKITQWYSSHKGTSHAIAGFLVTAFGAYATNMYGVQDYVNGLLKGHAKLLGALGGAVTLYLNYRNSKKTVPAQ